MSKSEQTAPPVLYDWMQFPVIWVEERNVRAFFDLEDLRTCNAVGFRAGERAHGVVVDRNLLRRDVNCVRVVGHVPPFRGYRLPGTRMLLLDFEFVGNPVRTSLGALKDSIIAAQRKRGICEDMAGSPRRYEAKIKRLKHFDEVVREFGIRPTRGLLRKIWAGPLDG